MKKIKVGILGLGRIGRMHIQNMQAMREFEIIQGVDPFLTPELEAEMKDYGVQACSKNPDDVFLNPEIEAVFICSTTETHSDYIIRSARNKKAIFCEKPIDHDVERICEALKVVREEGVVLQLGFVRRFDTHHGKIAKLVKEGKVGNAEMLRITSRDSDIAPMSYLKTSGGIYVDMLIHDFDMARYVMGQEVVEVYAAGSALVNPEMKTIGDVDSAFVTLKFENGSLGLVEGSRRSGFGYDQRVEVLGSEGCLTDYNIANSMVTFSHRGGVDQDAINEGFQDRYKQAFINELLEFKDAMLEGREPSVTGIDGLKSVLIAEAANRSALSGKSEKVEIINL